tara:strand:+ start:576 stop:1343 length:768 start_codon:yes stop_codon:yes gene_type:complete
MISLLNFIDTGFIITLGLLLLVSGAVMLYCYRRLNMLENSLIEHGKILQNFIMNYNNQSLINQHLQVEGLENQSSKNVVLSRENKISVSDEDEDDDYEDDDYEDDHDNESDEKKDNNKDEYQNEDEDEDEDEDEHEDEDEDEDEDQNNSEDEEEKSKSKNRYLESTDIISLENPEDVFLTNLPIDLNVLDLNLDSKIIKLESNNTESSEKVNNNEKKNYSRMKVDELRSLVVTKNLISNEKAQLQKKNDLLKLLQ